MPKTITIELTDESTTVLEGLSSRAGVTPEKTLSVLVNQTLAQMGNRRLMNTMEQQIKKYMK